MSRDKLWPDGHVDELEAETGQIRRVIKKLDDVVVPESGAYYDSLEARIMASLDAAIESGEVKARTAPVPSDDAETVPPTGLVAQAAKIKSRPSSIRVGQLAILASVALLSAGKWLTAPSASNQTAAKLAAEVEPKSAASQLRATHQAAPEVLTGTVISFESGADLALEIAARRLVAYHKGE